MQAGNDFFNTTGTATGSVTNNQATVPGPITGATLLSGAAGTNSMGASFGVNDTITVNGTPITFVASGATGNQVNVTDNIQTLLSKIDSITGTSTPSTISGGVISIHSDDAAGLSVSSPNTAAFAALGFSGTATAVTPPLRIGPNTTTAASGQATNQATIPGPVTGATLLSGAAGAELAEQQFRPWRHHYRQRHADYVCRGRCRRQPGQPHRQHADAAVEDRCDHGDDHAVVCQRRCDLDSRQRHFAAHGREFEHGGVRGDGIQRDRDRDRGHDEPASLTSGTPANTVKWYTGNPGPISTARASATARVDASVKVEYGIQANEQAIRSQLQTLAVFSAVTTSTTNPNGAAQVSALSQRVTQALTPQTGKQSIQDIQTDLATAQATMSDATARQKQAQGMLQSIVDQTETISPDQVATQLLALQTALQASYQTTSMLSQMSLVKYLT